MAIAGGDVTRDAVYCWSDSSPTYLISLFVIKNYSQADIINLPTQPYALNGALQNTEEKRACTLFAVALA